VCLNISVGKHIPQKSKSEQRQRRCCAYRESPTNTVAFGLYVVIRTNISRVFFFCARNHFKYFVCFHSLNSHEELAIVAHTCNPSDSRGRDQEDHCSRPAWTKNFTRHPSQPMKGKHGVAHTCHYSNSGVSWSRPTQA
jgi:hypothetical protein